MLENQVDKMNIFTFMDDLMVDVTEKFRMLISYICKKCFIKVQNKLFADWERNMVHTVYRKPNIFQAF